MKNKAYYTLLFLAPLLLVSACVESEDEDEPNNFSQAKKITNFVNSSASDAGPEISPDGITLYFHSDRDGQSSSYDIYSSARESIADVWSTAVNLGPMINSTAEDRAPTISTDGLELIFSSNRSGGFGLHDLYVSTRADTNAAWGIASNLGNVLNTQFEESGPSISNDGLSLYFHADIPGGFGLTDIYVTTRISKQDPWAPPISLGSTINSTESDLAPDISADNLTLYFHSTRSGGLGSHNIWQSQRSNVTAEWQQAIALPEPVNSTSIETGPSISSDNQVLYFGSDRPGSDVRDIWQVSR